MALFKTGCLYCFGLNDWGQIGIGDLYGEYTKKKNEERLRQADEGEAKTEVTPE